MTRDQIYKGPGAITFGGVTLFDKDGITATPNTGTEAMMSSINGKTHDIKTDNNTVITATPYGAVTQELLDVLFPYESTAIGAQIFADSPLVIHGLDATKLTYHNAALTKSPAIILAAAKTAFGAAEFTALLADGKLPGEASSFLTVASAAYALGIPDPALQMTGKIYTGVYGSTTFAGTLEGWNVEAEYTFVDDKSDAHGTIGKRLSGVTCRASCTPYGITPAALAALLPLDMPIGGALIGSNNLVITGPSGSLKVTLFKPKIVTGPCQWGSTGQLRVGQIGFVATRSVTAGVLGPAFKVEIPA